MPARRATGFVDHVVHDILGHVGGISARAMFGGHGLYKNGIIFGIIIDDEVYFKVGETNKADYERQGSHPFVYERGDHVKTTMSYWLVPGDVLDDPGLVASWIDTSVAESKLAKAMTTPRRQGTRKMKP